MDGRLTQVLPASLTIWHVMGKLGLQHRVQVPWDHLARPPPRLLGKSLPEKLMSTAT
jgi:hypothetical protein